MTTPAHNSPPADTEALLLQLRRKQGTWVDWAAACQSLQKMGLSPQAIFEGTGFEPIQQNQIVVAGQVYQSITGGAVSDAVLEHFTARGSDALYELRILAKEDRARAVQFIHDQGLDSEEVRDIAKALKEYAYRSEPPKGFTDHPGDAVAFSYWGLARQKSDLQARSRLIAQGLRFAHSGGARSAIEKLLTDFEVVKEKPAPRLPLFRLETDSDIPCVVQLLGEWPLSVDVFQAALPADPDPLFGIVRSSLAQQAWVPVPGWQVVITAQDPVALLLPFNALPGQQDSSSAEMVLVLVDRQQQAWDDNSYFVVAGDDGLLTMGWFDVEPSKGLLGRVIVIVRPKKVLDEDYTQELWQIDE
ncbi:RuBisCO accumulation factor 1 [Leptothoe sp. PORK10 BA2]|uniref:RuBisCO accumulation factor 1 n=1 Tax=Leptothoe sp. PORK10 BA2 TaxID=3110254 RepID=UPI002B2091FF|nr:RuBisCO accumulation factor 1 [Leptothoe sp. PORK10 BA2]MEA5465449.1 RuBisCO accumulation factor 1 [Leptothoe sp. PORK10 BA2]